MPFKLLFTLQASVDLDVLEQTPHLAKRLKAVRKALGYLETNPRHLSLQTHKYSAIRGLQGEEIFEAYAENHMPNVAQGLLKRVILLHLLQLHNRRE